MKVVELAACAAAALLMLSAPPSPAAPSDAPATRATASPESAAGLLKLAAAAVEARDFKRAGELARATIAARDFSALGEAEQHAVLYLAGYTALDADDFAAGHEFLKRSSVLPQATNEEWLSRLASAMAIGDHDDAITALQTIAARWPEDLSSFPDDGIFQLVRIAPGLPNGEERQFALVSALLDAKWTPADPGNDPSWLALLRLTELLKRGDTQQAAAVADTVGDPYVLVTLRIDRTFDPIASAVAKRPSPETAIAQRIETLRVIAAAEPKRLAPRNALARMLMLSGDDEGALAVYDQALAAVRPANGKPSRFEDEDKALPWTMDGRAHALLHLGRAEEAAHEEERASQLPENGKANVSQKLNLAHMYDRAGQPQRALDLLADFTPNQASPYGAMVAESARAQAYAQLGNKAGLDRSIAYAQAHANDAPTELINMLLMAEDLDGAAALLIRRLHDPGQRQDALMAVQTWREPPVQSPFYRKLKERGDALTNRPDVREAVAEVGRIQSFSIYPR